MKKLAGVRSSTASAAPPVFDGPPCEFSCVEFEPIDATIVQRLLSQAACKSCELDPVPTWVIQKYAVELSPFISALFNASMRHGVFPASQKLASITPVLKKASLDPLDLSNYRTISNLTFLSKLLERAVHEQITGYLDSHHLLPETQSAYRKNRSTETATIKVMSDAYQAADAGLVTLLGLLDLSAAFDTVDHQILLKRLIHEYGITGRVIEWIQSYLTGCTQIRPVQRNYLPDNGSYFRCPSRLRARTGPLHSLFRRGLQHRWAPRSQGSWLRRRPTSLRSRRSRWRLLYGGSDGGFASNMSNLGWPRIAFGSTRRKQS